MYAVFRRIIPALFLVFLSGLSAGPASAAELTQQAIEALEPGAYIWEPDRAVEGQVEIVIGLEEQRAWVFRGGELIGASTVSSGKEGKTSPYGRFQILEKKRTHRSNRYNDAPMPYMQRLNWHGIALHGGHVPGYPASHGCIRLPMGFAKLLFGVTRVGTAVHISWQPLPSPEAALEFARLNADAPMKPDRLPAGWGEIRGTQ
jgi:hypothetical protein